MGLFWILLWVNTVIAGVNDDTVALLDDAYQHSRLADSVYRSADAAPPGWRKSNITGASGSTMSGLQWQIYERTGADGRIERAVTFAGTNPKDPRDWVANAYQYAAKFQQFRNKAVTTLQDRVYMAQYHDALKIVERQLQQLDPNTELVVVGHSLAGSISQYVSAMTGTKAYVFNSAPLSADTMQSIPGSRLQAAGQNIVNMSLVGDPVTSIPGSQLGRKFVVEAAAVTAAAPIDRIIAGHATLREKVGDLLTRHAVSSVADALQFKRDQLMHGEAVGIAQVETLPVRTWWLNKSQVKPHTQLMQEAQTLTGLAKNVSRVVVFGNDEAAKLMAVNMRQRLGNDNVLHITQARRDQLTRESRRFNADLIMGVRDKDMSLNYIDEVVLTPLSTVKNLASGVTDYKNAVDALRQQVANYKKFEKPLLGKYGGYMDTVSTSLGNIERSLKYTMAFQTDMAKKRQGVKITLMESKLVGEVTTHVIDMARKGLLQRWTLQGLVKVAPNAKFAQAALSKVLLTTRTSKGMVADFGFVDFAVGGATRVMRGHWDRDSLNSMFSGSVRLLFGAAGFAMSGGNLAVAFAAGEIANTYYQLSEDKRAREYVMNTGMYNKTIEAYTKMQIANVRAGGKAQSLYEWLGPKRIRDLGYTESDVSNIERAAQQAAAHQGFTLFELSDQKNIKAMTGLVKPGQKVIIVGDGPKATATYEWVTRKLGHANVRRLPSGMDRYHAYWEAGKFKADTMISIRESHERYREVRRPGQGVQRIPIPDRPIAKTPQTRYAQQQPQTRTARIPDPPKPQIEFKEPKKPELERRRRVVGKPVDHYFFWQPPGPGGALSPPPPPPPPPGGLAGSGHLPPPPGGFGGRPSSNRFAPLSTVVGGVMLQGQAQLSADNGFALAKNFSLIFNDPEGHINVQKLRMFVTALWAVYFSEKGPGISIDPIGRGIDRHLVRYIGNVVNSDLGRVMRESDYLMKKWSVGTERADVAGFMNPEDFAEKRGVMHVGAWSRFWFVPDRFKFLKSDDTLLYQEGRMRLRTEYMFVSKGEKNPENESFADYFTENYWQLAQRYPVLEELFEYARLVSLAKYLKQQKVPLFWYLLANRDLVLTEDSPGTVEGLIKDSVHFKGVQIEGGVDLKAAPSQDNYVFDTEAMRSLQQALQQRRPVSRSGPAPAETVTVNAVDGENYTISPSSQLTTSNMSMGGNVFQTDLVMGDGKAAPFELVRYYQDKPSSVPDFGRYWRLALPFRVEIPAKKRIPFLNAQIPEKIVLVHELTGVREVLTFNKERYHLAGYLPDDKNESKTIGVFLFSDFSYRMVDKIGCEYHFDSSGRLKKMLMSKNYKIEIQYDRKEIANSQRPSPLMISPAGRQTVRYANVVLPKHLTLDNHTTGKKIHFSFADDNPYNVVGFLPDKAGSGYKVIALMSNGDFLLEDDSGHQYGFGISGKLIYEKPVLIESIQQGKNKIVFDYKNNDGSNVIKRAELLRENKTVSSMVYRYRNKDILDEVVIDNNQMSIQYDWKHNQVTARVR